MHRGFCGLLLVGVCVLLVESYNFQDGDFNQIILHEMVQSSSASDDLSFTRERRDAGVSTGSNDQAGTNDTHSNGDKRCQMGIEHQCCDLEFTQDQKAEFDKFKVLQRQCIQEIQDQGNKDEGQLDWFSCDKMKKAKEDYVCAIECVFKKLGMVDKGGDISDDNVKKHIKISLGEHQKHNVDKIATKCLQEAKDAPENDTSGDSTSEHKKCSPSSITLKYCIWRELIRTCPKELQDNAPICINMLDRLEKGFQHN